jgi:hypothetical protein
MCNETPNDIVESSLHLRYDAGRPSDALLQLMQ